MCSSDLVVEAMTGDGSKPTVYFKPNKLVSIVVVAGYFAQQMGYELGHMLDARDPKVIDDRGLKEGEGIDEELPLYRGKVTLEN